MLFWFCFIKIWHINNPFKRCIRTCFMDQKEQQVQGMFDKIAKRYDFLNRVMSLGMDLSWKKQTAKNVSGKGKLILDVASGTGDIAAYSKFFGSDVIGLDFSMDMLRVAKSKFPGIIFIRANAQLLPFKDGVFDGAISGYALRNFSDMQVAISEMNRVMKNGGLVSIIEFSHPKNRLWNFIYKVHMVFVVPILGRLFSDGDSYSYLPESIRKFPNQEGIVEIMESKGFDTKYKNLLWGASAIWTGKKV